MLAITAIGGDIDFATLRTEPFSNIVHFRIKQGRRRSMRISNWGESLKVSRRRLDSNFYDDETVTARCVVGELVQPNSVDANGWSTVCSAVKPYGPIVAVTVFVTASQHQDPYGKSWIRGGTSPEDFLREVLASLR